MAETFEHAPLDHTKSSIRLLKILPDLSATGSIQCEIWHDATHAEYTCLSYVWGSEHESDTILVNGKTFTCRKNLWDFLNVARKKSAHTERAFWIDAICIDQSNVSERNHQVSQMGQIYSRASTVLGWLGCDKEIERFCKFLIRLAAQAPGHEKEARKIWGKQSSENYYTCWVALWNNAYWRRAWVTQEIFLAQSFQLLAQETVLGTAECRFLSKLSYYLGDISGIRKSKFAPSEESSERLRRFEKYLKPMTRVERGPNPRDNSVSSKRTLLGLLHDLAGRQCQIPRDLVYSLLSIADDGARLTVDYGSSDEDFLVNLVKSVQPSLCVCTMLLLVRALNYTPLPSVRGFPSSFLEVGMSIRAIKTSNRDIRFALPVPSTHCKTCRGTIPVNTKDLHKKHLFCMQTICETQDAAHLVAWKDSMDTTRLSIAKTVLNHQDGPFGTEIISAQGLDFQELGERSFKIYLPLEAFVMYFSNSARTIDGCCSRADCGRLGDDPLVDLNIRNTKCLGRRHARLDDMEDSKAVETSLISFIPT
jgi:hypothetical protein